MNIQEEQELFRKYELLINANKQAMERIKELESIIMKVVDAILLVDDVLDGNNPKQERR